GEAAVADLARSLHVRPRAELVLERDLRLDAVQLLEIDGLHVEPAQAHLHALTQVLGTTDGMPFARAGPREPALGRDRDAGIKVKRLAEQILGDERPVGI